MWVHILTLDEGYCVARAELLLLCFRLCSALFQLHKDAPAIAKKRNESVGMQSHENTLLCGGKDDTEWKIREKNRVFIFNNAMEVKGEKEKEFQKSATTKRNNY